MSTANTNPLRLPHPGVKLIATTVISPLQLCKSKKISQSNLLAIATLSFPELILRGILQALFFKDLRFSKPLNINGAQVVQVNLRMDELQGFSSLNARFYFLGQIKPVRAVQNVAEPVVIGLGQIEDSNDLAGLSNSPVVKQVFQTERTQGEATQLYSNIFYWFAPGGKPFTPPASNTGLFHFVGRLVDHEVMTADGIETRVVPELVSVTPAEKEA